MTRVSAARELPPLTEKEFLAQIIQLAKVYGFRTYHPFLSIRSERGFPDLTLVKPGRLIFAELKTDRGKLTEKQEEWLMALREAGAEAYVWRPAQWDEVVAILGGQTMSDLPGRGQIMEGDAEIWSSALARGLTASVLY